MTAAACPNCRCRDMGGADQWREDGEGFRRGRWVVAMSHNGALWLLTHDEAGQLANVWVSLTGNGIVSSNPESRLALEGFLTWFAATYPPAPVEPAEPTGLGAVVKIVGAAYVRVGSNPGTCWQFTGSGVRYSWAELTRHLPVTIMSEGVTS